MSRSTTRSSLNRRVIISTMSNDTAPSSNVARNRGIDASALATRAEAAASARPAPVVAATQAPARRWPSALNRFVSTARPITDDRKANA